MNYSQETEDEIYTKILLGEGVPQKVYDGDVLEQDEEDGGSEEYGASHSQVTFNLKNLNYVKQKLFDPEIQYVQKKFREEFAGLNKDNQEEFQRIVDGFHRKTQDELNVLNTLTQ